MLGCNLRYDFGRKYGPFGLAAGISVAENDETWIGIGPTYTKFFGGSKFYGELHAMPGIYTDNGGFDLGGDVQFR